MAPVDYRTCRLGYRHRGSVAAEQHTDLRFSQITQACKGQSALAGRMPRPAGSCRDQGN
jgi:hypothetical protein